MSKDLTFHCPGFAIGEGGWPTKTTATHTFTFRKKGDKLLMGWSRPHLGDVFNKKIGRELAVERLNHIENRLDNFSERKIHEIDMITPKHLPNDILTSKLGEYVNRAVEAFYGEDAKDIEVVFKSYNQKVPYCSIGLKENPEEDDE